MPDDDDKSIYEKLLEQLTNPWDWVAAGAGAIGGGVASATVLHLDGGTAIGAGALGAVTARKAGAQALRRPFLKKKARGVEEAIEANINRDPRFGDLREELERERVLWRSGAITNEQFEARLNEILEVYRQLFPRLPR